MRAARRNPRWLAPVILAALCAVLAACNPVTAQRPPRMAAAVQRPALEYYHWVRAASERALEAELKRLEAANSRMDPLVNTVCRALLLSSPRNPSANEERALALLAPLEENGEYAPDSQAYDYLRLGLMWRDMLEERRRLRARAEAAEREIANSARQTRHLQQELGSLRQKIEALKSIEQQLNQRQDAAPGTP